MDDNIWQKNDSGEYIEPQYRVERYAVGAEINQILINVCRRMLCLPILKTSKEAGNAVRQSFSVAQWTNASDESHYCIEPTFNNSPPNASAGGNLNPVNGRDAGLTGPVTASVETSCAERRK